MDSFIGLLGQDCPVGYEVLEYIFRGLFLLFALKFTYEMILHIFREMFHLGR